MNKQLTWFSRSGVVLGRVGPVGDISAPALSPDGRNVAFGMNGDLWVTDLVRNATPTRFTVDSTGPYYPAWSPDGRYIAFTSSRSGAPSLYVKASSGAGAERQLIPRGIGPFSWTAAGLTYFVSTDSTGDDAYLLRFGRDTTAVPFLVTRFNEYEHRPSNDGALAVYVTEESGTPEVWLTTMPASDMRLRVSTAGGVQPIWSADDREITYLALDGKVMAVSISRSPRIRLDVPRPLFQANAEIKFVRTSYQPSADGQRILVNSYVNVGSHTIAVITNAYQLLKR